MNVESCISKGAIETARALLQNAVQIFPNKKSLWLRAHSLELEFGNLESQNLMLSWGVQTTGFDFLIILYAKSLWKKSKDPIQAEKVLKDGLSKNKNSEKICLVLQDLLRETGKFEEAQKLLDQDW